MRLITNATIKNKINKISCCNMFFFVHNKGNKELPMNKLKQYKWALIALSIVGLLVWWFRCCTIEACLKEGREVMECHLILGGSYESLINNYVANTNRLSGRRI